MLWVQYRPGKDGDRRSPQQHIPDELKYPDYEHDIEELNNK